MDQFSSHPLYKKHNIDSAMSSMWSFYKKKFLPLFLISLVMAFVVQYASSLIDLKEMYAITDPQIMLNKMTEYIWPMILISVLSLLFLTIIQYYVIYNPVDSRSTVPWCIVRSLRYFVPFIIIMILYAVVSSFILFLGILALIIGVFFAALYVVTIFMFFLPVMMAEGPSIANTISRTISLAHRNFWSNLGWTAVFILIMLVASIVLSGLVLLPFTGSFLKLFTGQSNSTALLDVATNPVYIVLTSVVNALLYPFLPIFASVLYFNGRASEEKPVPYEPEKPVTDTQVKVEDLYAKPLPEDTSNQDDEATKE
jgi:hypothetical protein